MTSKQMFRRVIPWLSLRGFQCVRKMTPLISVNKLVPDHLCFISPVQLGQSMCTAKAKFECINIQDDADFQKRVVQNKKPVVVDFHASWCGPCKLLGPRLEAILSKQAGKVVLAKVDIDDNMELAMQFGVQSVPTVIGMKNGKLQEMFIGLQEDDIIETFVEKLVH
ncbi:thioredoxin, mitochondrial-like [Gigantopelta aegis]|uniref:thioredoxin, mitochondrial-like n=1 Tax=Gigantopelta aegis TaxID=1735272 RepID=UPI001B887F20|nr:thioredoxin, mitochondrial-like [Gigantopelta aegis]XP_041362485.1 thioredoxin, mitochondrial-like [Gigantopelta aegis]